MGVAYRPDVSRWLRDMRGGVGLLVLGAALGGGAYLALDSLQPPEQPSPMGALSLRTTFYGTCREAFMDGRANIRAGEPGYRRALDADGDGLACEPYVPARR